MHPGNISVTDFSYTLPEEKIARFPLPVRDLSKLLIYKDKKIIEDGYYNIANHLPAGSLLVFNNTRVVEARIIFQKPTGGLIEIFALEPHSRYPDITTAMQTSATVWWKCLIGGAGKWKKGQVLNKQAEVEGHRVTLSAEIVERSADSFTIAFSWEPATMCFSDILHYFGVIPIPPYLKRETTASDLERYQTIYAAAEGSVAAPTAGLHFTQEIFTSLAGKNISKEFVTLHVGAGTFMPVKTEKISGHNMHAEFIEAEKTFLRVLAASASKVFAVGTTSLRTLESLYWMGLKAYYNPFIEPDELEIKQWEVYDELEEKSIPVKDALRALISWMDKTNREVLVIKTSILIAPPYKVKVISGLITNFHQPNSTLLLLVAALIGDNWLNVYDYALQNDFRFLSYGDGCLLYV